MKTTRNSRGQFLKGVAPWAKGKKFSEETKEKMRQAKLRNPTKYWKGKKRVDLGGTIRKRKNGYRYIAWSLVEPEVQKFFKETLHKRPVAEHQYVWMKYHKKKIERGYVIHHINERRDDNRIENLKLMRSGQHSRDHLKGKPRA